MRAGLTIELFLLSIGAVAAQLQNPTTLPVEVAGSTGTTATALVSIPTGLSKQVRTLWMQIHGIEYDDMVTVRVNGGAWMPLNNKTVSVAEPGRSYGGIGGGFSTLQLSLALPVGAVVDQGNTIEFRLDRSDGVANAFRVLAFNFLTADGRRVLSPESFVEEDPNAWRPPLTSATKIAAGEKLWRSARLVLNDSPKAPRIRAHCADCHSQDGRDLKYFNFSNRSIVARSRFHGLSEFEGEQIASYIRALAVPNPGRPWNPPFQPGPRLDSQPANWSAGAGLSWVLSKDTDTLPFLFAADKSKTDALAVTSGNFRPDGNLNPREVPIAMQLPDWNHWLPRVHPADAWGARFDDSTFAKMYLENRYTEIRESSRQKEFFNAWIKARNKFLSPHLASSSPNWTPDLSATFYSAQLWQLVKTWEMMQTRDSSNQLQSWPNTMAAATAPVEVQIPDGPNGMGGSALTNEYYSNAWYEVQILTNSGTHQHHDRWPVDWVYLIQRFLNLEAQSGNPEPARLLVAIIKSLQSINPLEGPSNFREGWRPDQTIDPRIMINERWEPMFKPLPAGLKTAIADAFLTAWLDKNLQYPTASYFQLGLSSRLYRLPAEYLDISGGKAWEAAPGFRSAGVRESTVRRLNLWGETYSALALLFHY